MIAPVGYPQLVKGRTWLVVLGNANYRCQCTGECGQTHTSTGSTTTSISGRCVHEAPGRQLVAAPADPAATTVTASRAHIDELHAWCPSCLDGAIRKTLAAGRQLVELGVA
ncbi:hypothetical protein [Kribbella solani]|uniref:Uncharacterized protein n=1 Tax=Kribbella solani TaxID=236067 RepID=A0A841E4T6_9ACTN|nr:hypothetical protein [Kribbella solani]MBB5983995.1 hypothetical protein [Kribbella solani]